MGGVQTSIWSCRGLTHTFFSPRRALEEQQGQWLEQQRGEADLGPRRAQRHSGHQEPPTQRVAVGRLLGLGTQHGPRGDLGTSGESDRMGGQCPPHLLHGSTPSSASTPVSFPGRSTLHTSHPSFALSRTRQPGTLCCAVNDVQWLSLTLEYLPLFIFVSTLTYKKRIKKNTHPHPQKECLDVGDEIVSTHWGSQ